MMDQPTFADVDYTSKKRKTRRERFLDRMDGLIPWDHSPTSAAHGCSGVVQEWGTPLLWPTLA